MYFRKNKKTVEVQVNEEILRNVIRESETEENEKALNATIEVLNELPDEQTELIELRFFEQYSYKEIGAILEITADNAKVRVYRTLKKMKELISVKLRQQK